MNTPHFQRNVFVAVVAASLTCAGAALGQFHIGDIWVGLDNNQIVTGKINPDQTISLTRAFTSTFGDTGFDGFTANPGYDAAHVFDPTSRIGFNILSPLQRWTGTGFTATGGETLTLGFLTASTTSSTCLVTGFDLAVQPDGGWHRHLSMFLNPPPQGGTALPGIYLIKLRLYCTAPSVSPSPTYWIVFNYDGSASDQDTALAWVNSHLVAPTCPADIDHNNHVDVNDLLAVITGWGQAQCDPADANDDGTINVNDLLMVITGWGRCP